VAHGAVDAGYHYGEMVLVEPGQSRADCGLPSPPV
jgi:hypothetical protein